MQFIPTFFYYNMGFFGQTIMYQRDYTEELAQSHGAQLNAKFSLDTLYGYVTDNIPAEFLPEAFK